MSTDSSVTDEPVDLDTPDAPEDSADEPQADGGDDPDGGDEPDEAADEESTPNSEAAKWRHKFRDEQNTHKETRVELESMTARVESLQRQQVESVLAESRVKPAALWATTELSALVAEDGTVDPKAVKTAIDSARKTLGIAPVGKGNHVPGLGNQPSRTPNRQPEFADAFRPKRK